MPTREYQKIYDEALKLLEERPYVMLSFLGERVKAYTPKNVGLRQIIELSERLELLRDQDPSRPERVAVCKKDDIHARKAFEKKYKHTTYSPSDILRSVLCAFSQTADGERGVFLENRFPYKFRVTSQHLDQGEWLEIPVDKLVQKDGDFMSLSDEEFNNLVSNIKAWCLENDVKFDSFLRTYKKETAFLKDEPQNGQQILNNFLEAQRPDVRQNIVFPAEFISFFLKGK